MGIPQKPEPPSLRLLRYATQPEPKNSVVRLLFSDASATAVGAPHAQSTDRSIDSNAYPSRGIREVDASNRAQSDALPFLPFLQRGVSLPDADPDGAESCVRIAAAEPVSSVHAGECSESLCGARGHRQFSSFRFRVC